MQGISKPWTTAALPLTCYCVWAWQFEANDYRTAFLLLWLSVWLLRCLSLRDFWPAIGGLCTLWRTAAPCCSCKNWCWGASCRLHLQGRENPLAKRRVSANLLAKCKRLCSLPWRWRFRPKCPFLQDQHGATSQKTVLKAISCENLKPMYITFVFFFFFLFFPPVWMLTQLMVLCTVWIWLVLPTCLHLYIW
jgi:hypothetical protein